MKDLIDGKLDEALKYAESIKDDSLQKCLDRLKQYEETYKDGGDNIETEITTDFAPYSFYFVRFRQNTPEFISNGGIIFHGKHDNGGDGSSPTFSVNLTPTNSWAIHT
jgi:hypothetical protein